MPSLPAGTFPSTYDNNQRTSFEKNSGTGYLTTVEGIPTGGSSLFDGSGDYLTTATDTDLIIGTNDFTIEFWVYLNSFSGYPIIFDRRASSANNQVLETQTNGKFRWYSGGSFRIESDTAITTGSWNHIAIVRASGTTKMMLNGSYQSTTYSDSTNYSGSSVILGKHYTNASSYVDGYISNYREVIGTALYQTSNTGGSTYFDGTDDHIKVANNTSFALGTGDFTIEMWVNFTTTSLESGSNRRIFCLDEGGNAVDNLQICIDDGSYRTNGDLFLYSNSDQGYLGVDIRSGWHHIAIVRNSGTLKFYLDGVEKDSNSNTQDYSPGGGTGPRPIFGQRGDDKGDYHGYISNFRMVVGTAVYTSNFTPSTSALTDITNTQLLTCQNSTGTITDNSSHSHSLSVHGNTQADTTHPFSNYYSIPTIPLTAISNTKLLTCQNITGSISDASGNSISITASGDVTGDSSNPFAGGSTSTTVASLRLLGFDSAGSIHRFNNGGTIYNRLSNGLLVRVATRDSHAGFELNIGDSGVAGAGEISPLIAFDSANSVERYTQGTLYHEQVPAPGNNPGILVKMLTRDSLGGGNAATQSAGTAYAMNIGDSSIGNIVGNPARLLREDSANGVGIYNTGTIYGDVQKTALNTLLSTRVPRTNFKGNIGVMADSSGGGVGGVSGGGQITYTEILLNF